VVLDAIHPGLDNYYAIDHRRINVSRRIPCPCILSAPFWLPIAINLWFLGYERTTNRGWVAVVRTRL